MSCETITVPLLWRYHFACAERVTTSACNNPGCGLGKQFVRPSKMTTLHEKRGTLLGSRVKAC